MSLKSPTTIQLDREKWNEISRRLPNINLTTFVDHYLTNLLDRLIDNGIDLEDLYSRATEETLDHLENL